MKIVEGDLIELALGGEFDLIIHGCNCFNTMGAGIAKLIKMKFPDAYEADLATVKGDESKLGTISFAKVDTNQGELIIINAYTQYHWRGRGVKANYEAIKSAFKITRAQFSGLRIGFPAIGAGLAGGNWNIISKIIDETLTGEDYTFVKYTR